MWSYFIFWFFFFLLNICVLLALDIDHLWVPVIHVRMKGQFSEYQFGCNCEMGKLFMAALYSSTCKTDWSIQDSSTRPLKNSEATYVICVFYYFSRSLCLATPSKSHRCFNTWKALKSALWASSSFLWRCCRMRLMWEKITLHGGFIVIIQNYTLARTHTYLRNIIWKD